MHVRRFVRLVPVIAAAASVVVAAPPGPAQATAVASAHIHRAGYSSLLTQAMPVGLGRHVVTAAMTLRPLSVNAIDLRCTLRGAGVVLDSTVVRAQAQFNPPAAASNAFPRLGFSGVFTGPGLVTLGCARIAGLGTAPSVDRLELVADTDATATLNVSAGPLSALPSRLVGPGAYRAVSTLTLRPLDARVGDMSCRLQVATPLGVSVLDRTVVRVQGQFNPPIVRSNAFPRITLVGKVSSALVARISTVCTPVALPFYIQPTVDRANLVITRTPVAAAQKVNGVVGTNLAAVAVPAGRLTVVASATLRPIDARVGDLTCSLIARPFLAPEVVLDSTVARVQGQYNPPVPTSNAFPRLAFTSSVQLPFGSAVYIRCGRVPVAGFAQPTIDIATVAVTKVG